MTKIVKGGWLFVILTIACFACQQRSEQQQSEEVDPYPPPPTDKDLDCVKTQSLSTKQRRTFYPFSHATRIEIVSYTPKLSVIIMAPPTPGKEYKEDITAKAPLGLMTEERKLNTPSLKERINLSEGQIDELTEILYNYSAKGEAYGGCFEPRNAVLFFAKGNQPFAYVEICFACDNFEAVPENFTVKIACHEKYRLLKAFFQKAGIQYGLDEE